MHNLIKVLVGLFQTHQAFKTTHKWKSQTKTSLKLSPTALMNFKLAVHNLSLF